MDAYDWAVLIAAAVFLVASAAFVFVALVRDIYRD